MKFAFLLLVSAAALLRAQEARTSGSVVIHRTEPVYTPEAIHARLDGTVVLAFTIRIDGTPDDIHVVPQQWRFQPATRFSAPIATKATVEIDFRLPPPQ